MEDELRQELIDYLVQRGIPRSIEPQSSWTYNQSVGYRDDLRGWPIQFIKNWLYRFMTRSGWVEFHDIGISVDPSSQVLTASISQGVCGVYKGG
jgi:hypothetical protein